MKPFIAEKISAECWALFWEIKKVVEALPSRLIGPVFFVDTPIDTDFAEARFIPDCHIMNRALAPFFPVEVHDGIVSEIPPSGVLNIHYHSWLTMKGGDEKVIIDPWPLGSVSGPALFVQDCALHFGPECSMLHIRESKFQKYLEITTEAVRKIVDNEVLGC